MLFSDKHKKFVIDDIETNDKLNYNGIDKSLSLSSALNKIGLDRLVNNNSTDFNNIENSNPMVRDIIKQHKYNLGRVHGLNMRRMMPNHSSNEFDIVNKVTKKSTDVMGQNEAKDNDKNINDNLKNKKNNTHQLNGYDFS